MFHIFKSDLLISSFILTGTGFPYYVKLLKMVCSINGISVENIGWLITVQYAYCIDMIRKLDNILVKIRLVIGIHWIDDLMPALIQLPPQAFDRKKKHVTPTIIAANAKQPTGKIIDENIYNTYIAALGKHLLKLYIICCIGKTSIIRNRNHLFERVQTFIRFIFINCRNSFVQITSVFYIVYAFHRHVRFHFVDTI